MLPIIIKLSCVLESLVNKLLREISEQTVIVHCLHKHLSFLHFHEIFYQSTDSNAPSKRDDQFTVRFLFFLNSFTNIL